MIDVRWLTAFIDMPEATFAQGTEFWLEVTGSTLSPRRGLAGQFATLLPANGDAHLRVQRTDDGSCGVHLDLHVADPSAAQSMAESVGARTVDDTDVVIMSSPGGFTFCLVGHDGETSVASPHDPDLPYVVDQVCIDVPAELFDAEVEFWSALTGWELGYSSSPEFAFLKRPDGIPLRILFQRLGADDGLTSARAHLDVACGLANSAVAERFEQAGATVTGTWTNWVALRDPSELAFCATRRDPATGRIPG
ncbi:MAG: hypothetical protein ACI91O_001407 [Candidatus Poriferisodalaceae bacterium]|jgi:hypothetical protein